MQAPSAGGQERADLRRRDPQAQPGRGRRPAPRASTPISGASYTSAGYNKSLQSALDKASAGPGATGGGGGGQAATVTGDAVDTQYGPVQVRVTVSGGKITKAEAVQQPKGGRSDQISGDAVPKLNKEAVTTSSANIDAISGASYTSAGYKKSLQSALDKVPAAEADKGKGGRARLRPSQPAGSAAGSAAGSGAAQSGAAAGGATSNGGGTYTGAVVQTEYGPVQVRVTLTKGRITSASAVRRPRGAAATRSPATRSPSSTRKR